MINRKDLNLLVIIPYFNEKKTIQSNIVLRLFLLPSLSLNEKN